MTIGKGGKQRKKGKNFGIGQARELWICEEGQNYAQIQRMLGNGMTECNLFSKKDDEWLPVQKMKGTIRGKMRNRVWINAGDIVVVSIDEDLTVKDKCDIIHKFHPHECLELKEIAELPPNITINEGAVDDEENEDDVGIGKGGDSDGEEDKKDDLDIDDL